MVSVLRVFSGIFGKVLFILECIHVSRGLLVIYTPHAMLSLMKACSLPKLEYPHRCLTVINQNRL